MKGISILITAYNTSNFIEECLDSIERQTYFKDNLNYEILLGIDGCESTLNKVKSIMHKYRNLHVFYMTENKGTYITTNTLLVKSRFDYILRFDSDDIMADYMIEKSIPEIEMNDIIYFCSIKFEQIINNLRELSTDGIGVILFKREIFDKIGGFMPWICGADSEFFDRFHKMTPKPKYKRIKEPCFYRRNHPDSLTRHKNTNFSSDIRKKYFEEIKALRKQPLKYIEPIINSFYEYLTNTKSLDEYIIFSKHYGRLDQYQRFVDKYKVRKYVEEKNSDILVPLYGVYSDAADIKFDSLPEQFVLKATNDYKYNIIVKDKNNLNIQETIIQLNKWKNAFLPNSAANYHFTGSIIAEKYLGDNLIDYKFFCFYGKPKVIQVIQNRHNGKMTIDYYNTEWEKIQVRNKIYPESKEGVGCPINLSKMIEISSDLSEPFPFVRVDLYNIEGKIYFGELTFTPANGRLRLFPEDFNIKWGKYLYR